ncbi:hypothetical protein SK128_027729 [Halocaridina rubra]|uniref:Uncharacterized protein n=1 Tax=Halocaridina rubra TaxID=373956 RepID=A0AAN8XR62_HALRR
MGQDSSSSSSRASPSPHKKHCNCRHVDLSPRFCMAAHSTPVSRSIHSSSRNGKPGPRTVTRRAAAHTEQVKRHYDSLDRPLSKLTFG